MPYISYQTRLEDAEEDLEDGNVLEHAQDGCVGVAPEEEDGDPHLVDGRVPSQLCRLYQGQELVSERRQVQLVEAVHDLCIGIDRCHSDCQEDEHGQD
jgi:hypothetical protein